MNRLTRLGRGHLKWRGVYLEGGWQECLVGVAGVMRKKLPSDEINIVAFTTIALYMY
jgi:hypothetical protein